MCKPITVKFPFTRCLAHVAASNQRTSFTPVDQRLFTTIYYLLLFYYLLFFILLFTIDYLLLPEPTRGCAIRVWQVTYAFLHHIWFLFAFHSNYMTKFCIVIATLARMKWELTESEWPRRVPHFDYKSRKIRSHMNYVTFGGYKLLCIRHMLHVSKSRVRVRVIRHLYSTPYFEMNPLLETLRYGL